MNSRDLARVAGKIISLSPAVVPAALYSRSFFAAITGKVSWDAMLSNPTSVRKTAEFCLGNLDRFNGRAWWPHPVQLKAAVDASGVGFGGILILPGGVSHPFSGTFDEASGHGSSTLRELTGYVAAVELATELFPNQLRGASIQVTSDNQGAIASLNSLRSPVEQMNGQLQRLFNLSIDFGFHVQGVWEPRERLELANALSRKPDASDWGLSPQLFQQVCKRFRVQPTWDLFASDVHHTANHFITRIYSPGCAGAQAFGLDWKRLVGTSIAWVFPPLRAMSSALTLVERFQINALVVLPNSKIAIEQIQLQSIPEAIVSLPFTVPRAESSCIPSLRVPASTLNPAFVGLQVRFISWDS